MSIEHHMNPLVKVKWIEALRSGSFNQTREVLKDDFGYCCLGVLCEVAMAEGVPLGLVQDSNGVYNYGALTESGHLWDQDVSAVQLPKIVADWAGLGLNPELAGDVYIGAGDASERSLAGLNDLGYNFEDIANLIEVYL